MHSQERPKEWFAAFFRSLTWMRILLIAGTAAILVGVNVYVVFPLNYSASANILAVQPAPSFSVQQSLGLGAGSAGTPVQRMEQILKSQRVRGVLVQKHELKRRLNLSRQGALSWLGDATKVEPYGARGIGGAVGLRVEVTVPGPSRLNLLLGTLEPFTTDEAMQMCAQLANDYVAALGEYLTLTSVESAQQTLDFVTERIAEVEASMSETEDRLQELQTQSLLMDPARRAQVAIGAAESARKDHSATVAEAAELASSLDTGRRHLQGEAAERIAQQVTERNPLIVSLDQQLASLQAELAAQLAKGKLRQHPDIVAIEAAISDIKQQLEQIAQEVLQQISRQPNPLYDTLQQDVVRLEVQLAGKNARKSKTSQQVQHTKGELRELPPLAREYVRLDRKLQIQTQTLNSLAREREAAAINVQRDSTRNFDVLDEAELPEKKSGPSSVKALTMTFVLITVLLGLGWAYHHGMFADYGDEAAVNDANEDK